MSLSRTASNHGGFTLGSISRSGQKARGVPDGSLSSGFALSASASVSEGSGAVSHNELRAVDCAVSASVAVGGASGGALAPNGGAYAEGACRGPSGALLGTVGKSSSTASRSASGVGPPGSGFGATFLRRFWLQSAARELLPREGVSTCLRRVIPVRPGVDILYSAPAAAAHYSGLMVCKSVWLCPVCSAKITERRRVDLSQGLVNMSQSTGIKRVLLVTFTLSHRITDNLSEVKRVLVRARKLLVSGRWAIYFNAKYGLIGTVRSLEVTYGVNGWHPHLHVLYFFDNEIPIIPFEEDIKRRWGHCVTSAGGSASYDHGCDVRFSDKEVANYVAKFGKEPQWMDGNKVLEVGGWSTAHELTKGPSKVAKFGGRTPLQLLSDFADGDLNSGALWVQYAMNFKGERQLCFSPGLRDRLGLDIELTDDEIASEFGEVAIILAQLNRLQWKVVLGNDARGELLQVASSGSPGRVLAFLASIGCEGVSSV